MKKKKEEEEEEEEEEENKTKRRKSKYCSFLFLFGHVAQKQRVINDIK